MANTNYSGEYSGAATATNNNFHFDCATNNSERHVVYNELTAEKLYEWFKRYNKTSVSSSIMENNNEIGFSIHKMKSGVWCVCVWDYKSKIGAKNYHINGRLVKSRFNDIVKFITDFINEYNMENNKENEVVEAPIEYKVHYVARDSGWRKDIEHVVFKSKENADVFIALMTAEGYEIYKWDKDSYMGDPKAIAAAKITTYEENKPIVIAETAEDEAEITDEENEAVETENGVWHLDAGDYTLADYLENDGYDKPLPAEVAHIVKDSFIVVYYDSYPYKKLNSPEGYIDGKTTIYGPKTYGDIIKPYVDYIMDIDRMALNGDDSWELMHEADNIYFEGIEIDRNYKKGINYANICIGS